MLYIVQTVLAGVAEMPQVSFDQSEAESTFVEHVKRCWKQSYSVYCERNGFGMDCFASAKAFLDTLDLSEKIKINYWIVNLEDVGPGMIKDLDRIKQRRENIEDLLEQMEQRSVAFGEELTGLLHDIAQLIGRADTDAPPAEVTAVEPEGDAGLSSSMEEKGGEEGAEKYATKEWKAFVGSIMNMCGGNRGEFPLLPRSDWRQDVYSDVTSLEYWDWVAARIETYRETAEKAGYTAIEDPNSPGHYKFRTPEGTVGETSFYSEWEAWCDAGMQLTTESPAAADNS